MTRKTNIPKIHLGLLGTSFPHLKLATYNLNSLSWDKGSRDRHGRIITNIGVLLETNHILYLQETNLDPFTDQALVGAFPHHKVFFNNGTKGDTAGQAILVLRGLLELYDVEDIFPHFEASTRTPDPTAANCSPAHGHIQGLLLKPKSRNPIKRCINLVNIYLSQDDRPKIEEINLLSQLDNENLTLMGGDFNFTEHRTDTTSDSSHAFIAGLAKVRWDHVVQHLRLREVSQPVHTYYFPGVKSRTSQ